MHNFDAERAVWIITAAYLLTLPLLVLARQASATPRERLFWTLACLGILALALNKQLDLQTQLTAFGRQVAHNGDWFDRRRDVQRLFLIGLGASMALLALWLGWLTHNLPGPVKLTLAGLLLLGGFVLLRAASFHNVDQLLRTNLLGTRAWVVIELAGIVVVMAGAGWAAMRARRRAA
ncbi:hypothetical protein [Sandaracinobacteroides hominis]|uniref:hypothetical protein n=1 Tax=Sandaracinobacteroides hominis TaxID=2780086 RepID=UPI0018F37368|nr:hypothetical protein [Sandaracinobacteroides hominis]